MARWLALLCVGLIAPLCTHAQRVNSIDLARSEVTFVARQMGVPAEGRFKRFSAQVEFDPLRPSAARARIEIDLASIDTGSTEVDTEVKRKPWFNVTEFPTATFVSSGMTPLGGGRFEVIGQMTLKGRTREVTAPFNVRVQGDVTLFEGAFTLKRLEYGIGAGPWSDVDTVADEVQVRFKLFGTHPN